jgi:hypothetical protein
MRNEMRSWLIFIIGIFAVLLLFINPFRESPTADDWSYALTVRHLVETGTYRLHDWAVANFVFQSYWGAFFSKIFGYSFITLRISTVLQAFLTLIAFYLFSREHDLNNTHSSFLSMGLMGCPLFLLFSVSFMTDVPFMAWSITAMLLYTIAIRKRSYFTMVVASLACSAAILIRQFGLALPFGILAVWLFQKNRKKDLLFFLTGLILPAVASISQFLSGILSPTWASKLRMLEQREYMTSNFSLIPFDLLWRIGVSFHYFALFALPFVVLSFVAFFARRKQGKPVWSSRWLALILFSGLFLIATMIYGRIRLGISWFMPYLPFYLDTLSRGTVKGIVITIVTLSGAIFFFCLLFQRYTKAPGWKMIPGHQRILDFVMLGFFLLQLIYVQFADRYLMVFLPFVLIVFGRSLSDWMIRYRLQTVLVCSLFILLSALWARGWLEHEEAGWKGGEYLRLQGVEPTKIFGTWEWVCYFTFQDFLEQFRDVPPSADDLYHGWLDEKRKQAQYLIQDTLPPSTTEWRVITEIPYHNSFFKVKKFLVLERISPPLPPVTSEPQQHPLKR